MNYLGDTGSSASVAESTYTESELTHNTQQTDLGPSNGAVNELLW